jgi:hypothetical protein
MRASKWAKLQYRSGPIQSSEINALIEAASDTGIANVIWNQQIWSADDGGPGPFIGRYHNGTPKNPHTDHIHIEFTRTGSQLEVFRLLELKIGIIRGGVEELARNRKNIA